MEFFAFILSLACVLLNAYGKILTWPLAIASSTAYAYVFFNSQLFGDAALQFVFVGLAIYAWITWYKKDSTLTAVNLTLINGILLNHKTQVVGKYIAMITAKMKP
jgi:nicotinamide mononucleotide transporter